MLSKWPLTKNVVNNKDIQGLNSILLLNVFVGYLGLLVIFLESYWFCDFNYESF